MADASFTINLVNGITGKAEQATKSLGEIEGSLRKVDKAAGGLDWGKIKDGKSAVADLAGGMKALGVAAGLAAAAVAAAAGVAIVKFGGAAIEAAGFAQKSKLALTQLTGSGEVAAQEFDAVRKSAADLGLDVDESVKSFQKLLAAQFSIGEAKGIIKMGADLRAIGASAENAQSAIVAITQIKSKGKLQGEELMQLQEAGVSGKLVNEALMKSTGQDLAGVQKMMSAGKIDAETGVAAIIEAIKHKVGESELGEAGAKFAATTIAGFSGKLQGGLRNAMIDIGTAVEPAIVRITTLISGSIEKLTSSGKLQALSDALVMGFERFAGFIESNWPAIEGAVVGTIDAIISGVQGAVVVLQYLQDHWETISLTLKIVGGVLLAIAAVMATIWVVTNIVALAIVVAVLAVAAAIAYVANNIAAWWDTIVSGIANFIGVVVGAGGELYAAAVGWASNLIDGLVNGITQFAQRARDVVANLGSSIAGAFTGILAINSPSKLFEDFGMFTVQGYVQGIEANDNAASVATAGLGTAAIDGISEVKLQGVTAGSSTAAVQSVGTGATAGGIGSGNTFNIPITITGADAAKDPAVLADDIAAKVRRTINSMLETAA